MEYHNNLVNTSETCLSQEIKTSESIEKNLLQNIKFASVNMAGRIVKYQTKLKKQEQQILRLKRNLLNENCCISFNDNISLLSLSTISSSSSSAMYKLLRTGRKIERTSK